MADEGLRGGCPRPEQGVRVTIQGIEGMYGIEGIDIYDPDRYADGPPHGDFELLRERAPVYRHPDPEVPDGFWAVTRHADVRFVSRNPEIFSSAERTCLLPEF